MIVILLPLGSTAAAKWNPAISEEIVGKWTFANLFKAEHLNELCGS
jgi:hypothetical protein